MGAQSTGAPQETGREMPARHSRFTVWFLIAGFLAVVYTVPLTQAALEIARGQHPQFLDVFMQAPTQPNLRAYERQLEESSVWAQAVRPYVQYVWFRLLGDGGEKVVMGREGWLFYRPDVRHLVERGSLDEAFHAIMAFHKELGRRGIRLLVLPVPGKPAIYPDKLTSRVNGTGALESHTRELLARLERSGVEAVDLFALFERMRRNTDAVYLLRDTHWSGESARVAAELVAARIRERGWIPGGSVEYTTRELRVNRRSDVARMIRAPGVEAAYPAEEVRCEQVIEGASGAPYRDDPHSPVLILGDSFLRMYQTDEPRAAGFIAHLARALRLPVASLVNDGGASTLVRQELFRRPQLLHAKRLVIWEFVERDISYGAEGWKQVPLPPTLAATGTPTPAWAGGQD